MGLDIYFSKRKIGKRKQEEVAYFRKVNCLVAWVEHNVREFDNCEDVVLSKEDITNLRDDARKVVEILKNAKFYNQEYECGSSFDNKTNTRKVMIETKKVYKDIDDVLLILPTQEGFFYGDTDIDEYYFENIKRIVKEMNKILREIDFNEYEIIFHCWW